MFLKVQDEVNLIRDVSSGAILNTDTEAWAKYIQRKQKTAEKNAELTALRAEVTELKGIVTELIGIVKEQNGVK